VTPRSLALVFGMLYLGLGALGLMPGALGGLLPARPLLGIAHVAIGAWALAAYIGRAPATLFARSAAFIFAALALAGMLKGIDHGPLVWVHLASAGLAGLIAWRPRTGERRGLPGDRRRAQAAVGVERRRGAGDRRQTPAAA
jgi:hypothetical protein